MSIDRQVHNRAERYAADPSPKRKRGLSSPVACAPGSETLGVFAHPGRARHTRRARRAFTLAETLVSILLTGGLLVAALNTLSGATLGQQKIGDRGRGQLLAQDLMAEILQQAYEEPDDTPVFGPEGSENVGNRAGFDDVDDYDHWNSGSPQYKDGTAMPGLTGWSRSVAVDWVNPNDLTTVSVTSTDVKRITVTVSHNDAVMAELVGIRTPGLPPPQPAPTILLVVGDPESVTAQESARVTLMESWGYNVELIAASDSAEEFIAATAEADVAYVSEEVLAAELGTKLRDAAVGVVNEDPELTDEFGFSSERTYTDASQVWVVDNTHYITSCFANDLLTIFSSTQSVYVLSGFESVDMQVLATTSLVAPNYYPSLALFDVGAVLYGGGNAAARRVQLPWGADALDINSLNADGQTLMQRAIEWAANQE